MKKSMGIMGALIMSLFFTGCAEDTLPNEGTEKTGQSLESEAHGEVAEGYAKESADPKHNVPEQQELTEGQELTEDIGAVTLMLSEEDLARIRLIAEEYYTSINRKMFSFTQADPASSFHRREYEGYEPDEVVLFVVTVENNGPKRYITIGSKDGWNNCSVLNEGY